MTAIATVPMKITPEAAARVAELGIQAELDQMLEHVRKVVPKLQSLEVELAEPCDTGDELGVNIRAWTGLPWQQLNDIKRPLAR
jgi:hypothetical protein